MRFLIIHVVSIVGVVLLLFVGVSVVAVVWGPCMFTVCGCFFFVCGCDFSFVGDVLLLLCVVVGVVGVSDVRVFCIVFCCCCCFSSFVGVFVCVLVFVFVVLLRILFCLCVVCAACVC